MPPGIGYPGLGANDLAQRRQALFSPNNPLGFAGQQQQNVGFGGGGFGFENDDERFGRIGDIPGPLDPFRILNPIQFPPGFNPYQVVQPSPPTNGPGTGIPNSPFQPPGTPGDPRIPPSSLGVFAQNQGFGKIPNPGGFPGAGGLGPPAFALSNRI